MSTMIRFLRQPERGDIVRVPRHVAESLIRKGQAESAIGELEPLGPVPVLEKPKARLIEPASTPRQVTTPKQRRKLANAQRQRKRR